MSNTPSPNEHAVKKHINRLKCPFLGENRIDQLYFNSSSLV